MTSGDNVKPGMQNCGAYKFLQHSLGLPVSIGCVLPGRQVCVGLQRQPLPGANTLALNIGIFVDKDRDRFGIGGHDHATLDRVKVAVAAVWPSRSASRCSIASQPAWRALLRQCTEFGFYHLRY